MKLVLLLSVLSVLSSALEADLQGRCDWGDPVTGSIRGNNVAFYDKKTLAECKALCDANTACQSIDFSGDQCYLGSCRIGAKCPNSGDAAYTYYACGKDPVWLPMKDKSASQSSVASKGIPSRALDGNSNSRWHGASCTHTSWGRPAWWQVDMGEPVNVTNVKVTNRGDCCGGYLNGFKIKVDGKECASNVPIAQGQTKDVSCVGRGRVIHIEKPGRGLVMLCEVGVGVDPSFASTMTTTAPPVWLNLDGYSATQSSVAHVGIASRAIDGNSQSRWHSGSCTHTHRSNSPWWQVDLGQKVDVATVKVTNRGDCCGDQMSGFTLKVDGKPCATGVPIRTGQTKRVTCVATGQIVRIEVPKRRTHLMLCEFAVGATKEFASTMTTTPRPMYLNLKGKRATQSSIAYRGSASRAIDGNSQSSWHSGSCTHTHRNRPAWWQVDLGATVNVSEVKVTNRGDCCGGYMNGFKVMLDGKVCATNVQIGQGQTKRVPCHGVGKIARIEVGGGRRSTYLLLCEFGVGVTVPTTTPPPTTSGLPVAVDVVTTTGSPTVTTTATTTTTTTIGKPSLVCASSPGVCEKGKWEYFLTNTTEAQCKKICDEGRVLVPEYGVQEYQFYFRQNGQFHDVKKMKPAVTRIVPKIWYSNTGGTWSGWKQRDHFYARWIGLLTIRQPGTYTFTTASDDGSFLVLNGKRIVNNPGWHGWLERHGNAVLEPGQHSFVIDYFEGGGGAGMGFMYKGPDTGNVKIPVPSSVLSLPSGGKYVPKWKEGMCAAYSHKGDACLIYTQCESVSGSADDICGSKVEWIDTFTDYKTCVYPKFNLS